MCNIRQKAPGNAKAITHDWCSCRNNICSLLIFLYNRNISSDKLEIQCIFNYDAGKPFQHDISFSYQWTVKCLFVLKMSHILLKTLNYRMDIVFPILCTNNVRKKKNRLIEYTHSLQSNTNRQNNTYSCLQLI